MRVLAMQGDTLDALCERELGSTAGTVERALEINPGLAALGPVIPAGTPVELDETRAAQAARTLEVVQLWQ